jgi:hypothetical protein
MPQSTDHAALPRFFLMLTATLALALFIGFAPSFFLLPVTAAPALPAHYLVHGVAGTAWIGLLGWQSWLIRQRRHADHRKNGMVGAGIAVVLVATSVWIITADLIDPAPPTNGFSEAAIILIRGSTALLFTLLVILGFRARQRPDYHKRYMVMATVVMMAPAAVRIARMLRDAGVPPALLNGGFLASLFGLALMFYDRRTLGKLHPVTLWVGGGFMIWSFFRLDIARSSPWAALVDPLVALAQGR